jgi:hypothetical protein
MWTTNNNPLNLNNDELNKARKMKADIDANLKSVAYVALITEDNNAAAAEYPEFDKDFK